MSILEERIYAIKISVKNILNCQYYLRNILLQSEHRLKIKQNKMKK